MANIPDLKSQIRAKNDEISNLANRIGDRIEENVDWRGAIRKQPFMAFGLCIGAGLLFSGALAPVVRLLGKEAMGLGKAAVMTAVSAKIAQMVAEKEASDVAEREIQYARYN